MDARQLEEISRRPLRHWNVDGLQDVLSGVTGVASALMLWALSNEKPLLLLLLCPLPVILASPLGRRAVQRAKERLTFPRAGRVELRKVKFSWRTALLAWVVLMAIPALLLVTEMDVDFELVHGWLAPVLGVAMGAALIWEGLRLHLSRNVALGLAIVVYALGVGVFGWNDIRDIIALLLGVGVGQILSGVLALAVFLQTTPLPMED